MSSTIEFLTLNLALVFIFVLLSICCTVLRDLILILRYFLSLSVTTESRGSGHGR